MGCVQGWEAVNLPGRSTGCPPTLPFLAKFYKQISNFRRPVFGKIFAVFGKIYEIFSNFGFIFGQFYGKLSNFCSKKLSNFSPIFGQIIENLGQKCSNFWSKIFASNSHKISQFSLICFFINILKISKTLRTQR